jgi:plasmid stabilization system protein ParE
MRRNEGIWSKEALDDRKQLVRYIAERDLTAAFGQDDRISEAIGLLEKGRFHGSRELVIGTRFIAVYQLEDGRPLILRVIHTSRDWPPKD